MQQAWTTAGHPLSHLAQDNYMESHLSLMGPPKSESTVEGGFSSAIYAAPDSSGHYISLQEVRSTDDNLESPGTDIEVLGLNTTKTRKLMSRISICSWTMLVMLALLLSLLCILILQPLHPQATQRENGTNASVCTSKLWSNGNWRPRRHMPLEPPINTIPQLMRISGFSSDVCASNRLPLTNTGTPRLENDTREYWDWRYQASSYEWHSGCEAADLPVKLPPTPEELIQRLVTEGGWLLIGDSLSAQWIMSLSCFLAPYVTATPDFSTDVPWNATQHIFLNPRSLSLPRLTPPPDFDPRVTPLITVLRSGLLLAKSQITELIYANNLIGKDEIIFGDEPVYDMHPSQYLSDFLNPKFRYSRLIASSGAHYTQRLLRGRSLHLITEIFHHSFEKWAHLMHQALEDPRAKNKKILYRTATAGHDHCNEARKTGPWNEENVLERPVWNWQHIPMFNRIADAVMTPLQGPRFQLLSIDRPAMLRPDAHVIIDCLHFTVGSGVIEGWTDYVYNYT